MSYLLDGIFAIVKAQIIETYVWSANCIPINSIPAETMIMEIKRSINCSYTDHFLFMLLSTKGVAKSIVILMSSRKYLHRHSVFFSNVDVSITVYVMWFTIE